MMVLVVCFQCGEAKQEPLAMCEFCKKKPSSRVDRIASMALSSGCLKENNLKKGSDYIKKTRRLPNFHKSVQAKAIQLVESYIEVETSDSDSMDLSSSFFEFDFAKSANAEMITVHAIGKPEHVSDDYHANYSKSKTYHTMQWQIGKEISADQAETNCDIAGDIFIWYRWMGDAWTWKCVSRLEFEQLKSVEA